VERTISHVSTAICSHVWITYEVIELKLGKGVIEGGLDSLGVVLSVPELRGDENVLTLDAELLEGALDTLGNLLLVLVAGWWKISSAYFSGYKGHSSHSYPTTPPRGKPSPTFTQSGRFAVVIVVRGVGLRRAYGMMVDSWCTYIFARS